MTIAAIILAVVVIAQFMLISYVVKMTHDIVEMAAKERSALEDRFMAVTQPLALTHVDAVRRSDEDMKVEYIDERREFELQED